jgi:hypothetical protein
LETIEGQQVSYEDDDASPLNQAEPYGFDSMAFADQDDYLEQFAYNDGGEQSNSLSLSNQSLHLDGCHLDGRESPDMNHWNSLNSGVDMDIDR